MIKSLEKNCFDWGDTLKPVFESFLEDASPSVIPYAVRAFGLQGIYPHVKNSKEFKKNGFKEALEWHTYRGTPRSFIKAFEWAGLRGCLVHEVRNTIHWTDYSIEVPENIGIADVETIKAICKICEPAKSRLTRIFTKKKDLRMLVPSSKNGTISKNILSNNSGLYDKDGILIAI